MVVGCKNEQRQYPWRSSHHNHRIDAFPSWPRLSKGQRAKKKQVMVYSELHELCCDNKKAEPHPWHQTFSAEIFTNLFVSSSPSGPLSTLPPHPPAPLPLHPSLSPIPVQQHDQRRTTKKNATNRVNKNYAEKSEEIPKTKIASHIILQHYRYSICKERDNLHSKPVQETLIRSP